MYRANPKQVRKVFPLKEMYHKIPHESWYSKSLKVADQGIKIFGTAKGLYEIGSAIASGVRAAAPMLALL